MRKTLLALCGALALLVIQAGAAAPPPTVALGPTSAAFGPATNTDNYYACGGSGQPTCTTTAPTGSFPGSAGVGPVQARWGGQADPSTGQTGLGFTPKDTAAAALGQNVQLGQLDYVNTAVFGSVGTLTLDETIPVATKDGPGTFHLSIPLSVDQTPNSTPPPCTYPSKTACADALFFPTTIAPVSIPIGQETYTLTVLGFTADPASTVPEDKLVVQENETDTGFLIGNVTRSNQPPVAADDSATVDTGGTVSVDVTANDSDPDGDPISPTIVSGPSHGTATVNGDKIDYTADPNYAGPDSFKYHDTDGFGAASNNAAVNVTIVDKTPPELTLPADITIEATAPTGARVDYAVSATDNVDPSVTPSCSPASGSTFPLGTTTVNCTATDSAGNSTPGSFTVKVQDTTPPTISSHANLTTEANTTGGAHVAYTKPTASDTVDPSPTVSCSPAPGDLFPLGSTTVNCTATDASGNSSSTSFTVSVEDTTPPTLTVPGPITVTATSPAGAVVTYTATATDIADSSPALVCTPASGSTFALGSTSVSCTATDASGNHVTKQFTVTVGSPLDALVLYANGLKPGNSFPAKAQNIKASFAGGSTATACSQLAALINEAKAQSGKQLTVAQANQLLSLAAAAGAFMGC